jgi:hypothetical protein
MTWQPVNTVEKTGQILAANHSYPMPGYRTLWYTPKVYHWDELRQCWSCPSHGIDITADREAKFLCVVLPPLPAPPAAAQEE